MRNLSQQIADAAVLRKQASNPRVPASVFSMSRPSVIQTADTASLPPLSVASFSGVLNWLT